MPRYAKPIVQPIADQTLVLDNGAYTMKAGLVPLSAETPPDCNIIPNCLARSRNKRIWIGAQLEQCRDFGEMAFRRPVERGYLVNWEAEKEIWERSFFDKDAKVKCDPHETNLILTEAPNAPQALQNNCDQMIFEEFEFASYYRCIGPTLNAYNDIQPLFEKNSGPRPTFEEGVIIPPDAMIVIDSGYSHTTITPLIQGRPIQNAIRRLDIGGKLLTNRLKELVSMRHYNMMDESYLMNECKETVCFVSGDFKNDLERTWKGNTRPMGISNIPLHDENSDGRVGKKDEAIIVEYVLPDYTTRIHGYMRPYNPSVNNKARKLAGGGGGGGGGVKGVTAGGGGPDKQQEEYMTLGNERFTVPELLFNPGDIGMNQAGLPETVMQSLKALPGGLWPAMLANVLLVGGNANIPGFIERLEIELRSIVPAECLLRIANPVDPIKSTYQGGVHLATQKHVLEKVLVTKQMYQEHGSLWLNKRFMSGT
ncbi:MAG: Actin- protein 6 [Watsoniomyces obsoletus]|nr:MAG: Actin- protein 6 [Watsoniomyces obsoletus]